MTRSSADSSRFTLPTELPLLTADLAPCQGSPCAADDFEVEEIPAYLPCGAGQHAYAWVEKRGLTTPAAIDRICEAVGGNAKAAGCAGLKDKHGVTRQWISFDGVESASLADLELPGLRVLQVGMHRNRLKTGHLQGNRFTVRVHDVDGASAELAAEALRRLCKTGLPNYYGAQRFGARGDNAEQGLRALRGEQRLPRDRRQRRLLISALQAQLFNEALAARLSEGLLATVLDGDVLQRRESGGLFTSEDRERDQARFEAGELALTGPMLGPKMMRPREQSRAREWEDELLARWELGPADFARFGKLAQGTRRPLCVAIEGARSELSAEGMLELCFSLPAGSYASVLLRELFKREMLGDRGRPQAPVKNGES